MTQLLVVFVANKRAPLDIINKIRDDLRLSVHRQEISEYSLSVGDFEATDSLNHTILVNLTTHEPIVNVDEKVRKDLEKV